MCSPERQGTPDGLNGVRRNLGESGLLGLKLGTIPTLQTPGPVPSRQDRLARSRPCSGGLRRNLAVFLEQYLQG